MDERTTYQLSKGQMFDSWVVNLIQRWKCTPAQIVELAVADNHDRDWAWNRVNRVMDDLYSRIIGEVA